MKKAVGRKECFKKIKLFSEESSQHLIVILSRGLSENINNHNNKVTVTDDIKIKNTESNFVWLSNIKFLSAFWQHVNMKSNWIILAASQRIVNLSGSQS